MWHHNEYSFNSLIVKTSQLSVPKSFDLTLAYIIGMSRSRCKHKSASILLAQCD